MRHKIGLNTRSLYKCIYAFVCVSLDYIINVRYTRMYATYRQLLLLLLMVVVVIVIIIAMR